MFQLIFVVGKICVSNNGPFVFEEDMFSNEALANTTNTSKTAACFAHMVSLNILEARYHVLPIRFGDRRLPFSVAMSAQVVLIEG